jgi:hypothetical protein
MNFNTAKMLPAHSLDTTGTGEPARQAASSGLPGCSVPAPARLRSRSPERRANRNTSGTDATDTAEEGSGETEKRPHQPKLCDLLYYLDQNSINSLGIKSANQTFSLP